MAKVKQTVVKTKTRVKKEKKPKVKIGKPIEPKEKHKC